jgi:hypothetical protein
MCHVIAEIKILLNEIAQLFPCHECSEYGFLHVLTRPIGGAQYGCDIGSADTYTGTQVMHFVRGIDHVLYYLPRKRMKVEMRISGSA